jgi:hypothetical protein
MISWNSREYRPRLTPTFLPTALLLIRGGGTAFISRVKGVQVSIEGLSSAWSDQGQSGYSAL